MTNVLTLRLDPASQAHFENLRQQHFPPERNVIAAHVTLFHTLPHATSIDQVLHRLTADRPCFPVEVTGVRSLGKGLAYRLASAPLLSLHAELAHTFVDDLSPQDRQRFQPHVVVQNKVAPAAARDLLSRLESTFTPWTVQARGLDLWHYLGGPWKHARTFPFSASIA